jgi:hypothetical protein
MKFDIAVEIAQPQLLAAVRTTVHIKDVAKAWKPALDQVWLFLRAHGGLSPGHNCFLYHHPQRRDEPMTVDFGVVVARPFDREGDVQCFETPRVRSPGRFMSALTLDWRTRTMQSMLGVAAKTGESDRPRGKPTATGTTIRLCLRQLLSTYCVHERNR